MKTATVPPVVEASQGQSAGLISRAAADIVDLLITIVVVLVGYLGLTGFRFVLHPRTFHWPELGAVTLSWVAALVFLLYLAEGWSITGRTLGKQMMGLRAVRRDGSRIRHGRAYLRAFLCTLFPVGLVWCAIDRDHRAVHDLILGTAVVYDWRRQIPRS
jgi:uncharacterized RDD family membrane protein YckC